MTKDISGSFWLGQRCLTLKEMNMGLFDFAKDIGNQYPKIFEANREVIKDPDLIFPGQKIRIPMD